MFPPQHHARRRTTVTVVATALAVTLASCSSSENEAPTGANNDDGKYPITLESAYGEVTLEETPTRIVTSQNQSTLILNALGVKPIATRDNPSTVENWVPYGETGDFGTIDQDLADENSILDPEKVATYDPDLIIANERSADKYEELSQIAPTYIRPEGDTLYPNWDALIGDYAKLTNTEHKSKEVLRTYDQYLREKREELSEVEGSTYIFGTFMDGTFRFGNGSLLQDVGMQPAEIQNDNFSGEHLGMEGISSLEADLIILTNVSGEDRSLLERNESFSRLSAYKDDRVFWADIGVATGFNTPTPQGSEYALDSLTEFLQ